MSTTRLTSPLISIIVPAYNEAARLTTLYRTLAPVLSRLSARWELILIDDGSGDDTQAIWRRLMRRDDRLGLITLARNFGKEAALMMGLQRAQGDVVVPMDADLQDPPAVLAVFMAHWREGFDMVVGVRRQRDDPWWKRLTSHGYYRLLKRVAHLDIPAQAGDFRLLDRVLVDRLNALPEVDRFSRGLYHWVGGRSCTVLYDRPARHGERRYTVAASIDQALAGLAFTDVPLQAVFAAGVVISTLAALYLVVVVIRRALGIDMAWGWASLLSTITFLGGVQLVCTGIIGLYIGRIFREVKRRPLALVANASSTPGTVTRPAQREDRADPDTIAAWVDEPAWAEPIRMPTDRRWMTGHANT